MRTAILLAVLAAALKIAARWSASEAGVADLTAAVRAWECPRLQGSESVRPLYHLDPMDTAGITEARERIELISRTENAEWQLAVIWFHMRQFDFWTNSLNVDEYQRRAIYDLETIGTDRAPPGKTPGQFVSEYRRQYDEACTNRNKAIATMALAEPALAALRRESVHPWLDDNRAISCGVARVDRCIP